MTQVFASAAGQLAASSRVFEPAQVAIWWSPADPMVVNFDIVTNEGAAYGWEISRDLLIAGSTSPVFVGAGDVMVRCPGTHFAVWRDNPADGAWALVMHRSVVDRVIEDSIRACVPGSDREHELVMPRSLERITALVSLFRAAIRTDGAR